MATASKHIEDRIAALERELLELDESMVQCGPEQYLLNLERRDRLRRDLDTAQELRRKHQEASN